VAFGGRSGSAISLLHGNVTGSALNGEAEILDVQKAKYEAAAAAAAIRTRSNSADTIKVALDGKAATVVGSGPPSVGGQGGKNIVISTINKANNTVVTKVLPSGAIASSTSTGGPSKVVLPPGVAARSLPATSPTSILSPRVLMQPSSGQRGLASSPSQGTQTLGNASSAAGTQTKVITVATSNSGM
jgi:hypothetical protein